MTRVAVMGAGSWGTAFALVLADAGNAVRLWARRPELAAAIAATGRNPDYLPGTVLPAAVTATADAAAAVDGAEVVVLAVPSQQLRACLERWTLPADALVVSLAKGVELGTDLRMSEVVAEAGRVDPGRIGIVTGPNLAREIAERQPAAAVVAATRPEVARRLQEVCHSPTFRPYTNTDLLGCELAGATKNVIALAVGMGSGLGYGANAMASVITRGLAETTRLGEVLGADPHTFAGLAGLGDLVATCTSPLSRNRTFGEHLGRGLTLERAGELSLGVAEGVRSAESVADLGRRHGVDLPIVEGVRRVVTGGTTPEQAIATLLARDPGPERA